MADIELDNLGENRTEQEEMEQAEDTSFTENTDNTDYDNIWDQIISKIVTPSRTNTEHGDSTDLERQIQDHVDRKAAQRYGAIQMLESATGTKFSVTHGNSSKELIDNISDAKYSEKGNLIALKYKGEDVKLTAKGKINNAAKKQNKRVIESIKEVTEEYNKSLSSVIHKNRWYEHVRRS